MFMVMVLSFIVEVYWKMVNTLSDEIKKQEVSWNSTGDRIGYILLWWGCESMKKRVNAVIEWIKNNPNSKVVITGYKWEIKEISDCIQEKIKNFNKDRILEVLSYDTVTNILNIRKKNENFFEWFNKFIIPTSKSHSDRVKMIFDRYLPDTKEKLQFIDTREDEVWYANVASRIYRVFNPKLLQYASIIMRPKKFLKEYYIPLLKEKREKAKKDTKNVVYDAFSSPVPAVASMAA